MSIHTREDLERLSRLTRRRFAHAFMSDTKWRKLFDAVNASDWTPSRVLVKFVDVDEVEARPMQWPEPLNFWGPPQWVDTPEFGPIELRSIQWLLIPSSIIPPDGTCEWPEPGEPQDLAAIKAALSTVGQFALEDAPEGLRILGYS